MDFFVYSRDAAGSGALRDDDDQLERHWSYMDEFARSMIARGPTLDRQREHATGSLHVLGLPSVDAAYEFVEREPNNRAGLYAEHSIWQFENLLGRTMWQFTAATDEPKFLVIARADAPGARLASVMSPFRLILHGALSSPGEEGWIGVAMALQAGGRETVDALLDTELGLAAFPEREVHDWEFGGRR